MEQQNKLTEEEKAYQALRTQDMQDMPDLWSRIDTGFEEEVTKQQAARKKRRTSEPIRALAPLSIRSGSLLECLLPTLAEGGCN